MSYVTTQVPRDIICEVRVYALTGGSASPESYPASPTSSFNGGITPMSPHRRALLGGSLSLTHLLMCDDDAAIREGDKVIIDYKGETKEYRVFHLDRYPYGGLPHKEAVLSLVEA